MHFVVLALVALMASGAPVLQAQTRDPDADLTGLWTARKRFGPDARGPITITRTANGYSADIIGLAIPVTARDGELFFELPNSGGFRGKVRSDRSIHGIWFPVPAGELGPAIPVTLQPAGPSRWAGTLTPQEDEQTFYLLVQRKPDGSLGAMLRNPERDYGAFLGVRGLRRDGNQVSLLGGRTARDTIITTGSYDTTRHVITFYFPYRGGSYDFRRDTAEHSGFYPRGKTPARYVYRVPPALGDGWETASVSDVGIDRAGIERAVQQLIDMSMDTINAPQVHSLLIVRQGKLVLEEYFHGEHRDKPHNVRSGSKSVTATIVGAAMQAGMPLRLSTPVYQVMHGGRFPPDLEPPKRALTMEHLLSMSSGYFCDDNNENAPGNENGMWDQTEAPDFYQFALDLPMATAPGEQAVYCSINPNLALGVLGRATGESPFYLFDRLVAAPLGIRNYVWTIDRARNPYGGGGMGLLSRDFIKFGQLMLDGGTWQGRRILDSAFVARAISPLYRIGQREYGLAWWRDEKPYGNGVARAFAMLGAGGNIVMVFPELELIVATTGGSYISRGWRYAGGELIPNYILPAIR